MDMGLWLCLLSTVIMYSVPPSMAAVYTVGDGAGWTLNLDYSTWTSDKTFAVGDSLVFNYGGTHNVMEVGARDYSGCSATNALSIDTSGSTTITLKTSGPHYFICGTPGHCSAGMKLAVTVASGKSPSPTTTTTTTTTAPSYSIAIYPSTVVLFTGLVLCRMVFLA